ncbi:uncharacterized protein LOC143912421 [Arctopsyche grandis]|uniref:uncharacterized protein LOC143912421 n=1 Tax=Arctopsyche grandis TaxID=121162 RepID=UPI00406D62EC
MCELFSEYFSSVHNNDDCSLSYVDAHIDNCSYCLDKIYVEKKEITYVLLNLDVNKGAGPDGIPPYFIKTCYLELVEPLFIIFNNSLSAGVFLSKWKLANIVPIFKSGDKSLCNNYRLIMPKIAQEQHGFGFSSAPRIIPSGVPQGSHLGPLLFIIFINDLIPLLKCQCLLYADDLKGFNPINNLNMPQS